MHIKKDSEIKIANGKAEDDVSLGRENVRDWHIQGSEQNPEMAEA